MRMSDFAIGQLPTIATEDREVNDRTNKISLKGGFSSGDSVYRLELENTGTGKIIYSDFPGDSEEFIHEIKVEDLVREIDEAIKDEISLQSSGIMLDSSEIESIRKEVTSEMLEDRFWEEINQTLEDPFFRSSFFSDEDWGEEFQTERGTTEELIEFLRLCVLTENEIKETNGFFIVEAETDFDTAGLTEGSYYTERLGELVEIACEYYKPTGFHYDYNDGCYDRMSGYCMSSESVSVSLEEFAHIPARERMLGMIELRKKLTLMEIENGKIERLTSF